MIYSDDPARDFAYHDMEQNRRRARLPVCDNPRCKCVIDDDHYFYIDGETLCRNCMEDRYMFDTEDYE